MKWKNCCTILRQIWLPENSKAFLQIKTIVASSSRLHLQFFVSERRIWLEERILFQVR